MTFLMWARLGFVKAGGDSVVLVAEVVGGGGILPPRTGTGPLVGGWCRPGVMGFGRGDGPLGRRLVIGEGDGRERPVEDVRVVSFVEWNKSIFRPSM